MVSFIYRLCSEQAEPEMWSGQIGGRSFSLYGLKAVLKSKEVIARHKPSTTTVCVA